MYTAKHLLLAFLTGSLLTLGVGRWVALERQSAQNTNHINYIEGFLEQATRGER